MQTLDIETKRHTSKPMENYLSAKKASAKVAVSRRLYRFLKKAPVSGSKNDDLTRSELMNGSGPANR